MNRRRTLRIGICSFLAIFLFLALTVTFVPAREIQGVLTRYLAREGYTLRVRHFGKAFPFGVRADNVEVGDERGSLLRIDACSMRVSLPALLLGRVTVNYHGKVGGGTFEGSFSPQRNGRFALRLDNVQAEDIPFLQTVAGVRAKGALHLTSSFQGPTGSRRGELRLWIGNAVLNGVKIGGMPIPDAAYDMVQGVLRVSGGRGTLESLTLQGRGIYIRLRGDVSVTSPLAAAPLNLSLELMPKPSFLESQKLVFLLLNKYLTTPGHYQIPIRGTLASPAVQP